MSTSTNDPKARQRIAQVLSDLVAERGGAYVAGLIGVCKSTPARRTIHEWSILDVAAIAKQHDDIRVAALELFNGQAQRTSEAIAAQGLIHVTLLEIGEWIAEAANDLKDGKIDADEAARLKAKTAHLMQTMQTELLPALEAYQQ